VGKGETHPLSSKCKLEIGKKYFYVLFPITENSLPHGSTIKGSSPLSKKRKSNGQMENGKPAKKMRGGDEFIPLLLNAFEDFKGMEVKSSDIISHIERKHADIIEEFNDIRGIFHRVVKKPELGIVMLEPPEGARGKLYTLEKYLKDRSRILGSAKKNKETPEKEAAVGLVKEVVTAETPRAKDDDREDDGGDILDDVFSSDSDSDD